MLPEKLTRLLGRPTVIAVLVCLPLLAWFILLDEPTSAGNLPEEVDFNRHIRPILSDKCFVCHGFDPGTREAGLRLDIREIAVSNREGYERPAIVPGDPGASELMHRVTSSDPDEVMPPPPEENTGKEHGLTEREISLLERWIAEGAEYKPHWSYITPTRPDLPATERGEPYVRNPIDRFVVAKLESQNIAPSPQADSIRLLRRVHFDLIGLPPTPEEAQSFLSDARPGAYGRVVDRLLASRHYGERMAIMWLDLVRYSETDGYHSDLHRHIYPYRDYVIQAFNENKPYDQFTREQIAGDLLPDVSREQLVASGFNRLGQATKEGGSQPKEYLAKYAADRVRTVGMAWLGSTTGCAECHDHKFDPITTKDFYSMGAFFADVKERGLFPNLNLLPPEMPLPDREDAYALEAMKEEIDRLAKVRADDRSAGARLLAVKDERTEILGEVTHTLVSKSVEPRTVRVLPRGNWQDDSGEIVEPDVPEFLPDLDVAGRRANRLDLADWLVSRENPLTARVFVNNLWARLFGRGLSKVQSDLGSQGELPTHPDLLDWLAVEFMESGWDVKHIVRLMVTSATYRQSSMPRPDLSEMDPENTLLARQARLRLPAELVRDNALAVSGLLTQKIGGPSVKPYQPDDYWKDIQTFGIDGPAAEWIPSEGEDQYRRGLYTYWKRSFLHPSLLAFNASDRQECTADRPVSNTPLQALVLLNDPTYVEAARVFAERMLKEGGDAFEPRLQWAYLRALSRRAQPREVEKLRSLYERRLATYAENEEAARRLVSTGFYRVPDDVDLAQLAAYTFVGRAVLNLHETITRY